MIRSSVTAVLLAGLLWGCSDAQAPTLTFPHSAVVRDNLAATEAILQAAAEPTSDGNTEVDPEAVLGLTTMLANSTGGSRELPIADIRTLGDGALGSLLLIATRPEKPDHERRAALELMGAIGSARATEQLLTIVESSPEAWMRSQAAWRLGQVAADWSVPRLLFRLKYEVDEETRIWIAEALALCGNYAGQEALYATLNQSAKPELQASAGRQIQAIVESSGVQDRQELWDLWVLGDPDGKLRRKDPSVRLQREVWRRISEMSGEHFQLRGVDDARYILSHLGDWAVQPLCEALHDEDVYVRVHVAQCLERMGGRASGAGPTLLSALADPSLAPAAVSALGEISYPLCEPRLRELLLAATSPHELRVACASALGRIGLSASLAALEEVLANNNEPQDLRQRAAISLCQMGSGQQAAPFLLQAMHDPRGDRFGAEVAIEAWLEQLEGPKAESVLQAWRELQPALGLVVTTQEAEARIRGRHELLGRELDGLLGR